MVKKRKKKKVATNFNLAEKVRRENEIKNINQRKLIVERRSIKMKLTRTFDLDNTDRKRKIWFMSDLHYNHLNIMKFCGRPFETVEEMNGYILNELSDKISKNDILFDLGDMIWKESQEDVKLLGDLLPSESYKIMGNHDSIGSYQSNQKKYWKVITDLLDIQIIYKGERIKLVS